MSEIIDLIISGITKAFTILSNFEFLGTNMLTFLVTIFILGTMLPVLLTLVEGFNSTARGSYKERQKIANREERKSKKSDK